MSIQLKNVVKRYNDVLAVDNISLTINEGEIFGLLGPNGAGKSTTIKMIIGLLKADSGKITINNMDVRKDSIKIKKLLGLVPQDIAIYNDLTVKENLEFFGRLYGLNGRNLKNKVTDAVEFTGLAEKLKEKPKKFSGGLKRRLNIACAIIHRPEIIIMDEPTVGIDPQSRNHILNSIKHLNSKGATIVYTSHYMEEVEAVCSRVGIIDYGKLIAFGTKEELKNQVKENEKIIIEAINLRYNPIENIKKIRGVKDVIFNQNTLEILTINAQQILQDVLFILSKENVVVRNIKLREPDLESVFLSLTGRKLRD